MKKNYIYILLLFSFFAKAQIVNIPDANFKAKLLQSSTTSNIAKNVNGNYMKIDANSDGEIQESEALLVYQLRLGASQIHDLTGISGFANLHKLFVYSNNIPSLDVSMLPLDTLDYGNNNTATLNVSGLTGLIYLSCPQNELTSLDITGMTSLDIFNCSENHLTGLTITGLTSLRDFNCSGNDFTALDITGLNALKTVDCSNNAISSFVIPDLPLLDTVHCDGNQMTSLTYSTSQLKYFYCFDNLLTSLDVTVSTGMRALDCSNNNISSLNVQGLAQLYNLKCGSNELNVLDLTGLTGLIDLYCQENHLATLSLSECPELFSLNCSHNNFTSLDFSQNESIYDVSCSYNNITSITAEYFPGALYCDHNLLTSVPVSYELHCSNNLLTSLDFGATMIDTLDCSYNQLTSLTVNCTDYLDCSNNQLTSLTILSEYLMDLDCSSNHLESLSFDSEIGYMNLNNNGLKSLFIKNNYSTDGFEFSQNPDLAYICGDIDELDEVAGALADAANTACEVNSYCVYTPGAFYHIAGQQRIDADNDGCEVSDPVFPHMKLGITNGSVNGTIICDASGNYSIPVQSGTHTITPVFENQAYYTISPTNATITFPASAENVTQNFCITPNGTHPDLEVSLFNNDAAVPGFDADYTIIYKNKGTTVASGTVSLSFDDAVLDFVNASPAASTSPNTLSWSYSNLQPFESREIHFIMNLNSPVETPPLNQDDVLTLTAVVALANDETPADNSMALSQVVVNAFDPNDKTCLEGDTILPTMVGEYVHYKIRFENTGNYPAAIVTVKDVIDTSKFDISTLVPITGSHPFITRITNANQVEFVFDNIMLPFDDADNDGFVIFKIKTKPTLVLGDQLENSASIYFNYNPPVITNTAVTTVALPLGTGSIGNKNGFSLYPNPVENILNISSDTNAVIHTIQVYNMLGQEILKVIPSMENTIDVSTLPAGSYALKLLSDKGNWSSTFIKK